MFVNDPSRPLWRLSVTPSDAPGILATLRKRTDFKCCLDWAGGLIWIELPQSTDAGTSMIRSALPSGHAMLFRAPEAIRAAVGVFQPQAAALAALSARVKDAFDPQALFNPGRMSPGV